MKKHLLLFSSLFFTAHSFLLTVPCLAEVSKGSKAITRAEFAKLIYKEFPEVKNFPDQYTFQITFADVSSAKSAAVGTYEGAVKVLYCSESQH